ncbi:MAG: type IX secretion system PorP/SprF family membrane protein [Flavobacteriales bacterium]|jgi:type IX secretion system PorP/SprF family membrane protein
MILLVNGNTRQRYPYTHGWIRVCASFVLLLFLTDLNAQQDWLYTQGHFDLFGSNEAFAGHSEGINTTVRLREQWVGFEGSPSTQFLSIHSPVYKKLSLGGKLMYDRLGAQQRFSGKLAASYAVTLGDGSLRFGLGAGWLNQKIRSDRLITQFEEIGLDYIGRSGNAVNLSGGLFYITDFWYVGVQGDNLNSPKLYADSNYDLQPVFTLMGGLVIELNDQVAIKPSIVWREAVNGQSDGDLGLALLLKNKIWIGGGYRYNSSAYGLLQFRFSERFQAGYSYDFTVSKLAGYESGSHELFLSYVFGKSGIDQASIRYFR